MLSKHDFNNYKLNDNEIAEFYASFYIAKLQYDQNSPCWIWNDKTHAAGYGLCKSPDVCAHTFSFKMHKGYLNPDLFILHDCKLLDDNDEKLPDNKLCCNPYHLIEGTASDNQTTVGAVRNRLSKNTIREIRKLYSTGKYSQRQLGMMYDMTHGAISDIVNKITYYYVKD